MAFSREHEVIAKPARLLDVEVRDRAHAWVLASAVAGQADVLVTGDQDLLVLGTRAPVPVLDPRVLDPRPQEPRRAVMLVACAEVTGDEPLLRPLPSAATRRTPAPLPSRSPR